MPSGRGEEHRPLDRSVLEEVLHVHAEIREARARERFVETGERGRRVTTLVIGAYTSTKPLGETIQYSGIPKRSYSARFSRRSWASGDPRRRR